VKTIKKLLNADSTISLGNHRVHQTILGRDFIYFQTVICRVNDQEKTFRVRNGGYATPSTARAISAYRSELSSTHKEILELKVIRKKRNGIWIAEDQVGKEWEIDPQVHSLIHIWEGKTFEEVLRVNNKINIPLELKEESA
jgi:hypothetical protein